MIHNKYLSSLLLFFTLNLPSISYATSIMGVTLETAVSQSEIVFEGEVTNIESRLLNNSRMIRTYVTFKVTDLIKGQLTAKSIEISFLGGQVGEQILEVSNMTLPIKGEKGIYLVESMSKSQVHPLTGWSQGHFIVMEDNQGIERVATYDKQLISSTFRNSEIARSQTSQLSNGRAQGLSFTETDQAQQAITKTSFKQQLTNYSQK